MGQCQFSNKQAKKDALNLRIQYKELEGKSQIEINNYRDSLNTQKNNKILNDIDKRKRKKNFNVIANDENDNEEIYENFTKLDIDVTSTNIEFIIKSLKENFLFKNLNDTEFEVVISNMYLANINQGEYIFRQNDKASSFFIINSGQFAVEIDGEEKKLLEKGASFGELALLYNAPRSASLKATVDSQVWCLHRSTFKKVLREMNNKEKTEIKQILKDIKILKGLTESQIDMLALNIIILRYSPNQLIVNKGDSADSYYLIKEGEVGCYDGDKIIRTLVAGDSFGEQALYENGIRTLTVKAIKQTNCLAISRETLLSVFGTDMETILLKNSQNWAIDNDPIFSKLNKIQIFKIINTSDLIKKDKRTILERKGKELENIYIILEGCIEYGPNKYSKQMVFGGDLLYPKPNLILEHDLIFIEGKYAQLSIRKLQRIIDNDTLEEAFERNESLRKKQRRHSMIDFRQFQKKLCLQDLYFLKELGQGQFGDVFLVCDKNKTENKYALKSVSRAKIAEHSIGPNIIQEKDVLKRINFPFIIRLYNTFKDEFAAHFLLSVVYGLDMFDMIRQVDLLDNDESRFYIGSMLICLEHLHNQNIIYRDLKPENTMIDKLGYLHLIDMGTSKILDYNNPRTFTVLGTPHYMAPEIIQGRGYGYMVDLWALGVCMYEFQCGYVPFGEEEEDPFDIYKLILNCNYDYPQYFLTPENQYAKEFIDVLLNKIPEARNNGSYAALKGHIWFEDFDWQKLLERELEAPYRPPQNCCLSEDEMEELINEKNEIPEFIKNRYEDEPIRKTFQMKSERNWESEFENF